jgi:hypothetical protein
MTNKHPIFQMGQDPDVLTDRINLKNGRAFVDPSRPDLVFMIPKSRVSSGWIRMGPFGEFGAIVRMARGDPLLALDIDRESVISLLPKSKLVAPTRQKEPTATKPKKKKPGAQSVRIESIVLHRSGRSAELLLVPV